MEPVKEIIISCQGATTVSLDDLQELQGNLKDLTEANYVKLRNSLIQFGFTFPLFFWEDEQHTKWIVDAHQRKRTLLKMRDEGYTIPPLPADPIFAKDKIEAKEKLLLLNSRYGQITQEGFDEFVSDVPIDDISDMLVMPEIMFEGQTTQEFPNREINSEELAKELNMKCPKCGFEFKGKEGIEQLDESSA